MSSAADAAVQRAEVCQELARRVDEAATASEDWGPLSHIPHYDHPRHPVRNLLGDQRAEDADTAAEGPAQEGMEEDSSALDLTIKRIM